jgi:heat-inducible transcriptional repressor
VARAAVATEMGADQQLVGALARMLEEHDATRSHDVYYDGIQNILAQPEFTETDSIRDVVRLLEDRTRVSTILPHALGAGEVHVAIGSEHRLEPLRGFSLVFGRYGGGDDVAGYVGVVGPTRMDYARSIGAVRYVGSLMSDLVRVMEGD